MKAERRRGSAGSRLHVRLVEQQRRKVAQHAVLHDERAASATRSGGKQALIA